MSDDDDFGWHAMNYRAAHTVHAQAMWVELQACLQRKIAAAVAEAIAAKDAEIAALRADRDSWEQQASDRVDDCLQFIEEAKELRRLLQAADVLFAHHCKDATAWTWLDEVRERTQQGRRDD